MRVAAIDLGSNSCVFLVLEGSTEHVVATDLAFCRLGEGLDGSGRLQAPAMERSLAALETFYHRAKDLGCEQVECVGTAALREGANRQELIDAAEAFGLRVRAISGDEEARLSARAALDHLPKGQDALVVDVGGASTEFIRATAGGGIEWRRSLAIGSVRLLERTGLTAPAQADAWQAVIHHIDQAFASLPEAKALPVVAVAGTATTLAMCHQGLREYDPDQVDRVDVMRAEIDGMICALKAISVQERMATYPLVPARADVFPVGLAVLGQVLRRQGVDRLTVRDRGVSWGLAQRLLARGPSQ